VTKAEAELLRKCEDPTHMVASWMIRGITVRQREGGVSVPPPILSRVYQELSNAMLGYNSALKVSATPFPFPYAQLNQLQVVAMIFTCPMIVAAFTESYVLAAVLTGLTVLGFQGLAEVACELESPFSSHSNELPLNMMHDHFNRQLEALLCPAYISHNYSILTDASSEAFDEDQEPELAVDQGIYSAVQRRSFVAMCPGDAEALIAKGVTPAELSKLSA
jgi:predicted membrane chloride channel (bestrophin family)